MYLMRIFGEILCIWCLLVFYIFASADVLRWLMLRRLKPTMRVIVWFGVLFFVFCRVVAVAVASVEADPTPTLRGLVFFDGDGRMSGAICLHE